MLWLIIGTVIVIALFVWLGFKETSSGYRWKLCKKQFISLVGMVVMLFSCFTTIGANTVGILYSPLSGGVQDKTLGEGLQMKAPWDDVYIISTEVQTKRVENLYGQTKDSQYLTLKMDVKWYVDKAKAFDVFKKFKTLENVDKALVVPATQRAIEDATINYNIIEVLGGSRDRVYKEIEKSLATRFEKDGITLHSVTFLDTDAGDDIEKAIKAEAVAKKAVETAKQNKIKAQVDADTRIIAAQAEAKEKQILAAAIAKNPEVLELEWIKKWNGELPTYVSGDSSGIMIDMTGK